MAQEISWFDGTQIGGLTAVATNIQEIQSGIGTPICMIITTLSTLIGAIVVGFIKEWRMTLVIPCITLLALIISGYLGGVVGRTFVKAFTYQEEAGKIAGEIISSIRTVTAFSIQGKALERIDFRQLRMRM